MAQSNVLPNTLLPVVLSGQLADVVAAGVPHDVMIGELPFRIRPSDENPMLHQLVEQQKDQFDSSREAGENSFGDWWRRSQSTFEGGQGQKYLDSGDPEPARTRFYSSDYAYPHASGELTIAGKVTTAASSKNKCLQTTWSGTQKLITASSSTNEIRAYTLPGLTGEQIITLGASGTPTAMTTDGVNVYVAIADKIWRVNSSGVATNTHNVTFTGSVAMGFAKQRLILTVGNKVYELDPNPGAPPVSPSVHYTNPSTDYIYTCVAEGPDGIYLSGYAGPASDVSSMSVTESGGSITLGPAIVRLRLPPAEQVNAIFFYVSSLFALATSNGVRIGSFTNFGEPQMGPLTIQGVACHSLTGSGTLIWVGATDSLWWIDLAIPVNQEGTIYSHSMYTDGVGASTSDKVSNVVVLPGTRDLVFGTTTSGNLISQTSWIPADEATLTTSWVRFGTTEAKRLHYIGVEGEFPAVGGITNILTIKVENSLGQSRTFNITGGETNYEFACTGLPTAQAFRMVFTLRDNAPGHGVLLRSWQMKALPVPRRYPEIVLPLLLNDLEKPVQGEEIGYRGFAKDRLMALFTLATTNEQVTVVDRLQGINYQAVLARVQFQQVSPPTSTNTLGGIVNVVLRLV